MKVLFWALTLSFFAQGVESLRAPYTLESADVLPGNVRNPRLVSLFMSVNERFGDGGEPEPLGAALNRSVSWNDVLAGETDPVQKALIESVLNDLGFALDDGPGVTTGAVSTFASIQAPALAWGVSEKMTVGLVVPIVNIDVAVDTGFSGSANGQAFIDSICETSPDRCNGAAERLNNSVNYKLTQLGYEPLANHSVSGIGDVRLLGKYKFVSNSQHALAGKMELLFPTGTASNANKAIDITTGDNRYQLGAGIAYRVNPFGGKHRRVGITFHSDYRIKFPHQVEKRLPASETDALSPDKEVLTREVGEAFGIGARLDVPFEGTGVQLGLGYSFQYQSGSIYTGSAEDEATLDRYYYLQQQEPTQTLHSMVASLGFSTVEFYRKKQFPLPFQMNVVYGHPLGGRNAPNNDTLSGELVLFF